MKLEATRFFRTVFLLGTLIAAGTAAAADAVYRLHVAGLSCPFCAYGLEKRLSRVPGVERIEIDLAAGAAVVTMAGGKRLEEAAARKAVEEAGFTLDRFEAVAAGARE